MLTEEEAAAAYAEATDSTRSTRYLVRATPENARQWQRVKPDEEVHPLAELDWEEGATWDEPSVTTPVLVPHLCSERTDCIALAIQPLATSEQPIGTDHVAAM